MVVQVQEPKEQDKRKVGRPLSYTSALLGIMHAPGSHSMHSIVHA